MSCCVVPGCLNLLQEWTTLFPCTPRLVRRWLAAIEVGTGQAVSQIHPAARICNMHFAVPLQESDDEASQTSDGNRYCEPTLFFRDNVLIQVANCELCLRFDAIDDMYKRSERIVSKEDDTLYSLAKKYFNIPKKRSQKSMEGFFCESCVIHIDMAHSFWRKADTAMKAHKILIKKMAQEKVVFRNTGSVLNAADNALVEMEPITTISSESSDEAESTKVITIDSDSDDAVMDQFEDTIVKEEPQLNVPDSAEQMPSSSNDSNSFKCFKCNNSFETRIILIEHINSTHCDNEYKRVCKNCNRMFYSVVLYNDHMATHKPFRCNHCPLEFDERREVVFHEISQHGSEKSQEQCDSCGKLFRNKVTLEEHKKTEHCV